MACKSTRPRAADLREIYLLVGECLELGADPIVWRRHLLERLNRLLGASASVDIESGPPGNADGQPWFRAARAVNVDDLTTRQRTVLDRCFREMPVQGNPLGHRILLETFQRGLAAATCEERIDAQTWRNSQIVNDYFAPLGWDDMLVGSAVAGDGLRIINFSRLAGEPPFPPRSSRMLALVLREIGAISESRLTPLADGSILSLPPRLRDVLLAIAEGDNERQIAARLGIARATVHEYVRRLFERFGVSTRSQLLMRTARKIHAAAVTSDRSGGCWLYQHERA